MTENCVASVTNKQAMIEIHSPSQDLYKITLAATAITGMAAAGGVEGGWRGANVTINLLSYPF